MVEFEGTFSLRKGRTIWFRKGLISAERIDGAEEQIIPDHIVYNFKDEQGRRVTRFVADVVNGPEAFSQSRRGV